MKTIKSKNPDAWVNDAGPQPKSEKDMADIRIATFETFKRQGVKADSLRDKEMAKDYAAWLADQPQP